MDRAVTQWCDRVLDGAVVLLATWTPIYHLCLVFRLGVGPAVVAELVVVAGVGLVRFGTRSPRGAPLRGDLSESSTGERTASGPLVAPSRLVAPTIAAALVAAGAMAVGAPWIWVWVPWLIAAGLATWWAALSLDHGPSASGQRALVSRLEGWVAVGWAVGLSALSLCLLRPNPDDLFYVNQSQWVASRGTFPLRDTLFSDLVYPAANWPPVASYDALSGTVARLVGAHAATVEYELVLPIATGLSVLALWRLLRSWGTPHVSLALSLALLFLLIDGTSSYGAPGNLFLTRLWQGKVLLLCLMVPLLLGYAYRYAAAPGRRNAGWLLAGGIAAVGLSTTAIFLVPVIAVAGAAPLARRAPRQALLGFAAMGAYPLGAGAVTLALGGSSADEFGERRLYRFDADWIGHLVFLTGPVALVGVFSVLVGALLIPRAQARLTTALLVVATGLVLVPGATHLAYRLVGLGPTLWRISFGLTVAGLVGVTGAHGWEMLRSRVPRPLAVLVASVVLAAMAVSGAPIWAPDTSARWYAPLHWQRSDASRAAADQAIAAAGPGGIVLAPDSLAITIAVTTTEVKTVAPRAYYLDPLHDQPGFHFDERLALVEVVNDLRSWRDAEAGPALRLVGVDVVCVNPWDGHLVDALERVGYRRLPATAYYQCVR